METLPSPPATPPASKSPRLVELDVLRGLLLLWMTFTHLPTKMSVITNQTFGFVSAAEGFIFLAGFMVGQIEERVEQKRGATASFLNGLRRTSRIYLYHCGLLAIAFTLVAEFGVRYHRLALLNLLDFYLHHPHRAIVAAALLNYRPSLFDILPMYIVFMLVTPLAKEVARRTSWGVVLGISLGFWAFAQVGLRAYVYDHLNYFGLNVPATSTGSFDLYGWQLIWVAGLAWGTLAASGHAGTSFSKPVIRLSLAVSIILLILRHGPTESWMDPTLYGFLIDKWHLGVLRIINFAALTVVLITYARPLALSRPLRPFASLGQASLEVFCVHILFCIIGVALNEDADPLLDPVQQVLLLITTVVALFVTAKLFRKQKFKAPATVPSGT